MAAPDGSASAAALPQRPGRFLWRYVRRRPWHFGALFVLIVGAAGCAVAVQYGMKLIVDAMAAGPAHGDALWRGFAFFIVLIAAESVFWRLGGWLGCVTVVGTGVDIRLDLFRHLAGHSMRYFSGQLAGSLGGRITATAGAVGQIVSMLTWRIMPPIVDFVGAVIVLLTIDVRMAAMLIAFVALVGWIITRFGIRGVPLHQAFAERGAQVNGELVDVVGNIWTVKAFSAREREYRRLQQAFGGEAAAQRRSWLYVERARVLHDLCLWLMAGTMLVWALRAWQHGATTAGDVVVISALTFRILHGSRDLALALVDASQQFAVVGEMLQVVAVPHAVRDRPGAAPFHPHGGELRFENVSFGYGDGHAVLHHFNLTVPAGQRLGIVGPSGAGKSTLVALLQRLEDVQKGRILIDGQPVTEVDQDSLRRAIAVVPQEIALFHRSVIDNIRYGRPEADDAQVHEAARQAHCDAFIATLPDGWDTIVGERGARLSGGQRQRVGIARAFLKDAPILVLDEATSALDSRSEGEIQRALNRLMHGRTVIAVAHRLATVSAFDRVIVLVDGRIVEDGAPDALRDGNGIFAELWKLQAEGFETA